MIMSSLSAKEVYWCHAGEELEAGAGVHDVTLIPERDEGGPGIAGR